MSAKQKIGWVPFSPVFSKCKSAGRKFHTIAVQLAEYSNEESTLEQHAKLEVERERIRRSHSRRESEYRRLMAAASLLVDLVKQGWQVRIKSGEVEVGRPDHLFPVSDCGKLSRSDYLSIASDSRKLIRMQLHAQRNEQLRKESVQGFIESMETKRYYRGNWVSIFSLMRDGREFTQKLTAAATMEDGEARIRKLAENIQPYVQFVKGDEVCEMTGLRLGDIWRYFRHTWANPYKSVPGRNMMLLVRDAATAFHAIIGIASLSSATVGSANRDRYLGWTTDEIVNTVRGTRSTALVDWAFDIVDGAIKELYLCDLYADKLITQKDVVEPAEESIGRLIVSSEENRKKHYRLMEEGDYKKTNTRAVKSTDYWEEQAKTPLFRSKRELELANLLKVRLILKRHLSKRPKSSEVGAFVKSRDCREVLSRVVRKAKADRVGTVLADLSICGAIPPYNEVIGAKLVAMLVASPEVADEYKRRYGKQPSIIASSMAGKTVIKPADLVFVTTTSLFGQRPNQYDRASMPCGEVSGKSKGTIRYEFLGRTEGVGTFHFSEETVKQLSLLVAGEKDGQKVHSIFGEGANPLMRKIREGLDVLGLSADEFMTHGAPRVVYGLRLVENLREYVLGMAKRPKYYLPRRNGKVTSGKIAAWWLKRWVDKRIVREDVLKRISEHSLVHPIRHGGRVELPRADIEQELLFECW
jgi:hypothetical protein